MKKYEEEELKILKEAYNDYLDIKSMVDLLIAENNDMPKILDYIVKNISCDITNCEFEDDYKYIDINYKNITISIIQEKNNKIFLGNSLEIWNDKENTYFGLMRFEDLRGLVL